MRRFIAAFTFACRNASLVPSPPIFLLSIFLSKSCAGLQEMSSAALDPPRAALSIVALGWLRRGPGQIAKERCLSRLRLEIRGHGPTVAACSLSVRVMIAAICASAAPLYINTDSPCLVARYRRGNTGRSDLPSTDHHLWALMEAPPRSKLGDCAARLIRNRHQRRLTAGTLRCRRSLTHSNCGWGGYSISPIHLAPDQPLYRTRTLTRTIFAVNTLHCVDHRFDIIQLNLCLIAKLGA